jgi:DNA polymerase-1
MKSLYILDASHFLYRNYFAIRHLTNNKGESTNALYGFIRSVLKLIKDFHPDHIVSVFDGPAGTEKRKSIYREYKANRAAVPLDLRYQIEWAQKFCDLIGISKLVIPKVEADDAMGAIATWAGTGETHVYLCTGDKDLCQLVNDNIFVLNPSKENQILGKLEVEKAYGVPPEKIIDFLAITGDSSDNVPGISGFGEKTAIALLKEFDSLETILAHPEKIPGKRKQEILIAEAEKARLSRQLVTLDLYVDVPKEDTFYQLKKPLIEELREFYQYMNFLSLIKELEQSAQQEIAISYHLVDDEENFQKLLAFLKTQNEICFDTEATHWKPLNAKLVGIGFGTSPGEAWYVPANGNLGLQRVIEGVKPIFENPSIAFYGHNVKYDWHILANHGIYVQKISFDTILASYLLNSHSRQHSLDQLTLQYFGKIKIPIVSLIGKGKNEINISDVALDKICEYCSEDVDYTCRLKQILENELHSRKLMELFNEVELPLTVVLGHMERKGIFLDEFQLQNMGEAVNLAIKELETEIYALAGETFNLNSPKQLSIILSQKLGLKLPKIATGLSTSADVLESLQENHPIIKKVLEYRTVEKLRSTYLETLSNEINSSTDRIHPTFNQSVAATGRLSCQDPNLQNIPVRSEIGSKIREAFRPQKPEWSYLAADYSQIELRLVAHFSEDPYLLEAFQNNEDIHTHTAATILNIPISQVTKEQRYHAKAVNFGIIYGQQAFGLSRELSIGLEQARFFIDKYFERYKKVKDFLETCKEEARKTGKATTLIGRERAIPEINSKNPHIRAAAERLAVNTPLQGTAADLIKLAMLKIDKNLSNAQSLGYMILQIHDELIFEIPDVEIPKFQLFVKEIMEDVFTLKVPLVVNMTIGKNWKEC